VQAVLTVQGGVRNTFETARQIPAVDRPNANCKLPTVGSQTAKPTDRLLGACSGRQSVGYRFSLLTLLFSGVFINMKPDPREKFRRPLKIRKLDVNLSFIET